MAARAGGSSARGVRRVNRDGRQPARLREIAAVRQEAGGPRRRWFSCPSADLYVWQDDEGIAAFEFCWDKPRAERVLRWDREEGALHARIDDGESHALESRSPVFAADGVYDAAAAALAFEAVAAGLEAGLYRFVLARLHRGPQADRRRQDR